MKAIVWILLLLIYAAMMYRKVAMDEAQVEKEDEKRKGTI